MIAMLSDDRQWVMVMASFTRMTGKVWSHPELHMPSTLTRRLPVSPGQTATTEVKTLVFKGTLDDGLLKVKTQRTY